ncbi:elongation factor G, mitochondrial-like isoform X2 [Dendrobium catenatum]|uniref:elongation factor G, mitochondrial-like isoform X2 n=1 Tax=Dendrobium catenatum TaxID=906689 RepID=UPI00109F7084|nr:elongation factor G, mitochondrial-like isoform X2 [Dendrobium catenatum]
MHKPSTSRIYASGKTKQHYKNPNRIIEDFFLKTQHLTKDGLAVYNRNHFLDGNLPDTEDIVSYENNDGEAEAMIEESPSGKIQASAPCCSCSSSKWIGKRSFQGLVDLVEMKAYYFHLSNGEDIVASDVPSNLEALVLEKRQKLIEVVSEVDDQLADSFLNDQPISSDDLKMAIRRAIVSQKFVPVYMGSAFKNKGVQLLLDGVISFLPCPTEVENHALGQDMAEEKVMLSGSPAGPLVALAFKLEEGRFGQLTYLRIYEGIIRKGDFINQIKVISNFSTFLYRCLGESNLQVIVVLY